MSTMIVCPSCGRPYRSLSSHTGSVRCEWDTEARRTRELVAAGEIALEPSARHVADLFGGWVTVTDRVTGWRTVGYGRSASQEPTTRVAIKSNRPEYPIGALLRVWEATKKNPHLKAAVKAAVLAEDTGVIDAVLAEYLLCSR